MGQPPGLPLKKHRLARLLDGAELTAWSVIFIFAATWAQAQDSHNSLGTSQDCTEISVGYEDDPTLTNEEKLALMDRGLFQSLSRFDACQNSVQGGGGAAGSNGATGNGSGSGGGASVASSDMSGTEAPPSKTDASSSSGQSDIEGENAGGSPEQAGEISDNGKVPEDIPSADNDSVLEAQIRQAAINESDPTVKEKLWNEYRRYKKLPASN